MNVTNYRQKRDFESIWLLQIKKLECSFHVVNTHELRASN